MEKKKTEKKLNEKLNENECDIFGGLDNLVKRLTGCIHTNILDITKWQKQILYTYPCRGQ